MSRFYVRLRQSRELLESWQPGTSFSLHFKQVSRTHKEWGSRDRKEILSLAYAYIRLGPSIALFKSLEEALAWGVYLYLPARIDWLDAFAGEALISNNLSRSDDFQIRLEECSTFLNTKNIIFPFGELLTGKIDLKELLTSFNSPAALWFRVRPERKEEFDKLILASGLSFERDGLAYRFPPGADLDSILNGARAYFGEVQDWASQQVVRAVDWNDKIVWDTCCASGGKSLQIMQEYHPAHLFSSDNRPAILKNFKSRFQEAGLPVPENKAIDLEIELVKGFDEAFDILLCDVPCSGSGTFRRNPEGMHVLTVESLHNYSALQEKIVANSGKGLKIGGILMYSTCSIYSQENEGHFPAFLSHGLELIKSDYINGLNKGADVLFYALFKKIK